MIELSDNPIVRVEHKNPGAVWFARVNPERFWQAVHGRMKGLDFSGDTEARERNLAQLAMGPSFTAEEIKDLGIATDMQGKPIDKNFNPEGFARCVIEEIRKTGDSRREAFFSRQVLQQAGLLPKPV